ncbi:MAG: hypothetical protein H6736_06780 [Alphaproteobacteria bacterium]|nr:hypothetical protein [Alphaproteobacteria bacterium]
MSVGDRLNVLLRRAFAEEIAEVDRIARRVDAATALLKAIDGWQQESHRWATSAEALAETLVGATPVQVRALLAAWLRRHSSVTRLPGDLTALGRNLGLDAIQERVTARRDRLGTLTELALVALVPALQNDPERRPAAGARMRRTLRSHERPQTRRRAAACLVELVALEPDATWSDSVRRELVTASTSGDDVWVRRQAVPILVHLDPDGRDALLAALQRDTTSDGALVRARAVELLASIGDDRHLVALLDDPTEIVRFHAVDAMVAMDRRDLVPQVSAHPEPRTRAWVADRLGGLPGCERELAVLARDTEPFVLRFALRASAARARLGPVPRDVVEAAEAARAHTEVRVRRDAERVLAWVAHHASPARALAEPLAALEEGERRTVRLPMGVRPLDLAIALRPYALDGFGFTLRPGRRGVRVVRGDVMAVTAWRVLHELRHPAPAKRQGHTHAVGPRLEGPIQVPPLGLAEQSATGVPGQRVQVDDDDWGPHLPTVDDYRRALRWGSSMVVSSAGVVEVHRPRGLLARMKARVALLWRYDALHQERIAALEQRRGERFTRHLEGMGFEHGTRAYGVTGFLPYLLSTSGNTLLHLGIMLGLFWGLMYGANVWLRTRVMLHRRRLGVVLGGWGTRGKSGTERIKAGMLSGAGVPYVSKTTGCEAMILHGPRGGRVHEIFLFRPFDKATIWEQADVVRFAATSGARAMIWECMALNPRYVDILQRGWMRDDMSTLTNAYPDHEDVMGPTGMDVAHVIGSFSPAGSPVFTAEENMFPVLHAEARRFGSLCTALTPAEKELIPTELIARFPYAEHPANIALAARVSTELGLPRVEAIGWMADHVIPDLGALMVYPEVDVDGRKVVFVNGHSANDELSFTHSWRHTGFAAHRVAQSPETWLVGVVNNRADRVPRSRVFARMVVRVAGAHRFLVIGTNLAGFRGFVADAVEELLTGLDLTEDDAWLKWSEHMKIPDPRGWLFYALRQQGVDPSELYDTFEALQPAGSFAEAKKQVGGLALDLVRSTIPEIGPWVEVETAWWLALRGADTNARRKALLGERLQQRVVLLQDSGASGDQVVSAMAGLAPPGVPVRAMGMQNIKGTGLDFVYQWVRWRTLHAELQSLDEEAVKTFGVKRLTSVFLCDAVLEALAPRGDADLLVKKVTERRAELLANRSARPSGSALGRAVRKWAWRAYDPVDAIWRRRRARQVLADLAMERIGHDEAELILAELTKRQK